MGIPAVTDRDQVPEDQRHVWDAIVASRGSVRGPFALLMHSPEVAGRVAHVGTFVRFESSLEATSRELAAMLRITYPDRALTAVILTPRVAVGPQALTVVSAGGAATSHAYGSRLFVFDEAKAGVYPLQDADQAGRYFLTYADRTATCS